MKRSNKKLKVSSGQAKASLPYSGSPPTAETEQNTKSKKFVTLTFHVESDWRKMFKMTAVSRDMDMHQLFFACVAAWGREQKVSG